MVGVEGGDGNGDDDDQSSHTVASSTCMAHLFAFCPSVAAAKARLDQPRGPSSSAPAVEVQLCNRVSGSARLAEPAPRLPVVVSS